MTPGNIEQLDELVTLVTSNCETHGDTIVTNAEAASRVELLWLHFLSQTQLTGTADCLLDGAASAIREATACVALGLVRPALCSLRLQIDLSLGWLYFKDHPIEWAKVQATGDGFKMKTELLKYLTDSYDKYGTRFGTLRDCKTRSQDDPYRLLSAHLHGQSEHVLPKVKIPSDIVAPIEAQQEATQLQFECAEFINDVLWSVYADQWKNIPTELRTTLECRFKSDGQRSAFYS